MPNRFIEALVAVILWKNPQLSRRDAEDMARNYETGRNVSGKASDAALLLCPVPEATEEPDVRHFAIDTECAQISAVYESADEASFAAMDLCEMQSRINVDEWGFVKDVYVVRVVGQIKTRTEYVPSVFG